MMRLEQNLVGRQDMQQRLAPRMIQAVEVLQMPLAVLAAHISQQLTENPALEEAQADDGDADNRDDTESTAAVDTTDSDDGFGGDDHDHSPRDSQEDGVAEGSTYDTGQTGEPDRSATDTAADSPTDSDGGVAPALESVPGDDPQATIAEHSAEEDFARLDSYGDELANVWEAADLRDQAEDSSQRDRKRDMMEAVPMRQGTLVEHLQQQLALQKTTPIVDAALERVLENLDERGFLTVPLDDLPRGKITLNAVIDAISLVQECDPPGVGARDLRECLLIQLDRLDPDLVGADRSTWVLASELVADHFDALQKNQLPAIARKTGLPMERIDAALRFVGRHCNAAPGKEFGEPPNATVVPDIVLEPDDTAAYGYRIVLTDTSLPPLQLSRFVRQQMESRSLDAPARAFLAAKVKEARWLIDAIEQRRDTIRRVMNEVVRTQRDFIDHGPRYLKPLPMQEIATKLGIHIATVSRAVSDKYVQCPRGIFRLRDCFSGGTQTDAGESVSYDAIREKVREIIAAEDKRHPLSDDAVAKMLKEQGIPLARRTVAKYRDELNIPSTRQRKQFA